MYVHGLAHHCGNSIADTQQVNSLRPSDAYTYTLQANLSVIWIKTQQFSKYKLDFKMFLAKRQPFYFNSEE